MLKAEIVMQVTGKMLLNAEEAFSGCADSSWVGPCLLARACCVKSRFALYSFNVPLEPELRGIWATP